MRAVLVGVFVLSAVGGTVWFQHLQSNAEVMEIRREAEADRQEVKKKIREREERTRIDSIARQEEMEANLRAAQDALNKLLGSDHFDTPEEEHASVSRAVHIWLDGVRKGRGASWGWYERNEPLRLYAVQGYEIVNWLGNQQCVVRIHSSTPEGQPIVRLYKVKARGTWILSAQPE